MTDSYQLFRIELPITITTLTTTKTRLIIKTHVHCIPPFLLAHRLNKASNIPHVPIFGNLSRNTLFFIMTGPLWRHCPVAPTNTAQNTCRNSMTRDIQPLDIFGKPRFFFVYFSARHVSMGVVYLKATCLTLYLDIRFTRLFFYSKLNRG